MAKVVVTGGAGFIGSHLVDTLLERDFDVHVIDNFSGGRMEERLSSHAAYHDIDVRSLESIAPIIQGSEYVFHLAALPRVQDSIDHPSETTMVNVNGTIAVLIASHRAGVKKVVFASSAAVYGDHETMPLHEELPVRPKSPYGLHKFVGERTCALWSELYKVPTVSLRYFNVYGPRFDPSGPYALVVGRFIDLRRRGMPLTIAGDGTNTRDYVHVADIARSNIMAAENDAVGSGEVCNIGSGTETSVNEIAALIGGPIEYTEPRIEPKRCVADTTRAKTLLGWEPSISLEAGVKQLLD